MTVKLKKAMQNGPVVSGVQVNIVNVRIGRIAKTIKNPDGLAVKVDVAWVPLDDTETSLAPPQMVTLDAVDSTTLIKTLAGGTDALTMAEEIVTQLLENPPAKPPTPAPTPTTPSASSATPHQPLPPGTVIRPKPIGGLPVDPKNYQL